MQRDQAQRIVEQAAALVPVYAVLNEVIGNEAEMFREAAGL
jgi:hypothetical protein